MSCTKEGMTIDSCRYNPRLGCDCGHHKPEKTMKPYKGEISNWTKRHFDKKILFAKIPEETLGYIIIGIPHGHPDFVNSIYTSAVISHNEETGEIETLNSRYKLI